MKMKTDENDAQNLRASKGRIEAALVALGEAEARHANAVADLNKRRSVLAEMFTRLNPSDDSMLLEYSIEERKLGVLEGWICSALPLTRAVEAVLAELLAVRPQIEACAQPRDVVEGTIAMTSWAAALHGIQMRELHNRVSLVRSVAAQVTRDIDTLLSAKRGALLRADERRDGIFSLGDRMGVRQLTMEERVAGIANE